ncbi:hypothetical protein BC829DRAFT_445467 [Chytridium lagenaria]|nr:hypothetical protein BC829DRAFT_445467 [Chytridium lagenaria]
MPDVDDEEPKSPQTTPQTSKESSPKPTGRKTSTPKIPKPSKPAQKLPKTPKLLKLVLDQQPFAAGYGKIKDKWQAVTNALKDSLTGQGKHFQECGTSFKICQKQLFGVGTDEEFEERERLLTDILEMMEFHELEKAEKTEKEKAEAQKKEEKGKAIVMAAAAGLVKTGGKRKNSKDGWLPGETASSSSRRKRQRSDINSATSSTAAILLKYFEQKDTRKIADYSLEERKLGMEEKKLNLEEKKLEEMKAERLYKEEKDRADRIEREEKDRADRTEREEKDRADRKEREEKDRRFMESQTALIQGLLSLITDV